jgi:luciferase family oxidoreductase group 1
MSYKLGLLDQSPIFPETSAYYAFQQTINLVQKAEEWGYERFWVSEHHHMKQVAGSSPEILMSNLLARTKSIRIGSGGVMLQHYSPYKVAENFNVLSTLAPGRVDLGVGKAPGGFPLSTKALQFGTVNDGSDFEGRLALLKDIVEDSINPDHPLAGIEALPKPPEIPGVYLLGASASSAQVAGELGIHFVYARFINSENDELEKAAKVYRSKNPKGRFIVSVAVVAAPDQQEAEELASSHKLYKVQLQSGRSLTVQSLEQAQSFGREATEPYEIVERAADIIAGTPSHVNGVLEKLHEKHHIDEFILHTPILKEEERFRSFQLLSPNYSAKSAHRIEVRTEPVRG